MARAQWLKKQSWRATSPNPEREKELNWRLSRETSTGLAGEIGVHQIDLMSWFHNSLPTSITGVGSIRHWNDGREVADTVTAMIELGTGVQFNYQCSLANSFESSYEILYGSDAAVLVRDGKAWLFKEVDAPLLGWEVYARKDVFYNETGISLVANASKSAAQGKEPGQNDEVAATNELQFALENFLTNVGEVTGAIEDFASSYNINDKSALVTYLNENVKRQPAAGYREAFEATVAAIKANEAIVKGTRVTIDKALYQLA
jgi:predicted dehydrogenase